MRMLTLFLLLPSVAFAGARASSFDSKSKLGKNYFAANAAIDGKLDTAWLLPGESANRGEWIEIDIPQGDVDKIAIVPGYAKNDETFTDYPRVKQMRVDIFALDDDQQPHQVGSSTVDVQSKNELQVIDLPDAKVAAGLFGGRVRLSIVDIYDGEDFPNLGISEINVVMKEFDATVKGAKIDDQPVDPDLFDGNPKTVWTAPGPSFTIVPDLSGYGASSIGFLPGGKDFARPKTVEVTINGLTKTTVLADKPTEVGWAAFPAFNGYTGGAIGDIEVKVVDTYPGAKSQDVKIADIKARATTLDSL